MAQGDPTRRCIKIGRGGRASRAGSSPRRFHIFETEGSLECQDLHVHTQPVGKSISGNYLVFAFCRLPLAAALLTCLLVSLTACGSSDVKPATGESSAKFVATPTATPTPEYSPAQRGAMKTAQKIVDEDTFGKPRLVEEVVYDGGYSEDDARFAVEHIDVDFNEEAAQYVEFSLESFQGAMKFLNTREQLLKTMTAPGWGFTPEQAMYGVQSAGL